MSDSKLPEHASLEYLKKLAKDRLKELRQADPKTKLASAQLAVARDHGFTSWRALKMEIEQRQSDPTPLFFEACAGGDAATLRSLLVNHPDLAQQDNPAAPHRGWTGLHSAAKYGHLEAAQSLIEHGVNPNARETGDNTYPLHWAAAAGHCEVVRALLDAGGDVHGIGDVHQLDAIGWATIYAPSNNHEVVSLLMERGARHHIFSAIALGDLDLIQKLVEQNPNALHRRMSRFEQGQSPLHFTITRKRYDILDLLITLGAGLEAEDINGHTALAVAMMRGDREAMSRLHAAGAKGNKGWELKPKHSVTSLAPKAGSVKKLVPMMTVPDVAKALEWYTSIGFKEISRYSDNGLVNFGMVALGKAELMLNTNGTKGQHDVTFWFYTDRVDKLYQILKSRQIEAAQAALAGHPDDREGVEFVEDINNPFYGGREFGIRDLNGYILYFLQPGE